MTVQSLARSGRASANDGACLQRMFLAGGLSAQRTMELLKDGNDDVVLHVQSSGRRMVSQCGREAGVGPGDGLLSPHHARLANRCRETEQDQPERTALYLLLRGRCTTAADGRRTSAGTQVNEVVNQLAQSGSGK